MIPVPDSLERALAPAALHLDAPLEGRSRQLSLQRRGQLINEAVPGVAPLEVVLSDYPAGLLAGGDVPGVHDPPEIRREVEDVKNRRFRACWELGNLFLRVSFSFSINHSNVRNLSCRSDTYPWVNILLSSIWLSRHFVEEQLWPLVNLIGGSKQQ